jgi:hypothetical protein
VVPGVDVEPMFQFPWRVPTLIKGTCTGKGCYVWVIITIPHTFSSQYFGDLTSPRGLVFGRPLDPLVFLLIA